MIHIKRLCNACRYPTWEEDRTILPPFFCIESRYPDQLDFDTGRNTLQSLLLRDSMGVLLRIPGDRHVALEARVGTAHLKHELLNRTRLDRNDQRLKDEDLGRCLKAFFGVYTNDTHPGSGFVLNDKWAHIQGFIDSRVEPQFWDGGGFMQDNRQQRVVQCCRAIRPAIRLDRNESRAYFYGLMDMSLLLGAWDMVKGTGDDALIYQSLEPQLPTQTLCELMTDRATHGQSPKSILDRLEKIQDERIERMERSGVEGDGIMQYMQEGVGQGQDQDQPQGTPGRVDRGGIAMRDNLAFL